MHHAFSYIFLASLHDSTWKCLISRFVVDMNTRQRLSFSFPELWYGLLEFNFREICQHLTNCASWNKRDKVWSSANSIFKWGFRSRRRRCYLSSRFKDKVGGILSSSLLSYLKMFVSVTREEAITDPLDFSTETFRLDLDVHRIAIFGPVSSDNR